MKKRGDKKKRFVNPHISSSHRSLFDVLLWQLGYYDSKLPLPRRPQGFHYPNCRKKIAVSCPQVTWINHCTFLIAVGDIHILTDPIWSSRCSPLPFLGPKRKHKAPFPMEELPPIDLVLLSHDHYDHFDKKTIAKLKSLYPKITWVVPLGLKKRLRKLGVSQIVELNWWDKTEVFVQGEEVVITAVPTQHFSGRGIFDRDQTLWAGFVLDFPRGRKKGKRLYFAGDTGYNKKDFKEIGAKFGSIDLSLIPIGAYMPQAFMEPVHVNPSKAVAIHQEVGSQLSIGMHWKTFRLSSESLEQPPYDLYCALEKKGIDPETFRILDPGQTVNW